MNGRADNYDNVNLPVVIGEIFGPELPENTARVQKEAAIMRQNRLLDQEGRDSRDEQLKSYHTDKLEKNKKLGVRTSQSDQLLDESERVLRVLREEKESEDKMRELTAREKRGVAKREAATNEAATQKAQSREASIKEAATRQPRSVTSTKALSKESPLRESSKTREVTSPSTEEMMKEALERGKREVRIRLCVEILTASAYDLTKALFSSFSHFASTYTRLSFFRWQCGRLLRSRG